MCGIAGTYYADRTRRVDRAVLERMVRSIRHRGPDDEGTWTASGVGLGSRRLAIIDLSPRARQPLTNEDGSLRIVFNGEVYNFQELRAELQGKGHRFQSASDTEVIVHLYEAEGVDCLQRLRGMFAFALWDAPRQTLFVARDRLGKKPLFYHTDGHRFVFGSEPKAILQDPDVPAEPDLEAIEHYLTYGYVPSPWSAFRGIRKLPPAHYLLVRDGRVTVHRYWSLRYTPKRTDSGAALAEELRAVLDESVRLRLVSDVPLGALLSGGLDSSTVVALMRRWTSGRVKTFSIGFEQAEYDEVRYAREVAARFDTDHHELIVKPDAVEMLPRLVWHYNEPFADSSAIPSFALAAMARRFVTVALNGDGGDESFLGYDRYVASKLAGAFDLVPRPVRAGVARAAARFAGTKPKSPWHRLRRFVEAAPEDPRRRYARWVQVFSDPVKRRLYTPAFTENAARADSFRLLAAAHAASDAPGFVESAAHADVQLYLPDDLLVKMDIASMAHSLEVRSPFLDHRVVEFAATLPPALKLRGLTQKYVIKTLMRRELPAPVLRRRKMGFGVPIDHWFRHELRDMAYDVLLDARTRQRGYFSPDGLRGLLDEHMRGHARHHELWALLMLELWHRMFIDGPCPVQAPDACA